jgi:hypothetical protein
MPIIKATFLGVDVTNRAFIEKWNVLEGWLGFFKLVEQHRWCIPSCSWGAVVLICRSGDCCSGFRAILYAPDIIIKDSWLAKENLFQFTQDPFSTDSTDSNHFLRLIFESSPLSEIAEIRDVNSRKSVYHRLKTRKCVLF